MTTITLKAPAKINLTLGVLGKRADGYHELQSVMQSVSLYDTLTLRKTEGDMVKLTVWNEAGKRLSEADGMPLDKRNLTVKAALRLSEYVGKPLGCEIELVKAIPAAAGMAGGSSDAAAVLYGLNKLYDLNLSTETLCAIGAKIGADVPFCIVGGTCLCEGIGERITKIPETPDLNLLFIKPNVDVPTKEIFTKFDEGANLHTTDTAALLKTLRENTDLTYLCGTIGNDLEAVTIPMHPVIDEIKAYCVENGAKAALMSGSGPTVYAIFETAEKAEIAREKAALQFPNFTVKTGKTCVFGLEEKVD